MRWLALLLLLATHQVFAAEKLGRGLVAIECERGVFLSWRLLATDPENVRFRIFRREGDSSWKLITNEPLTATNSPTRKLNAAKPTATKSEPSSETLRLDEAKKSPSR
jgi:rhamnogalacturonan endolyase